MKFAIPAKYLGTTASLMIDGNSFLWQDNIPSNIPLLGPSKSTYSSVENCAALLNKNVPDLLGECMREILKTIQISPDIVP